MSPPRLTGLVVLAVVVLATVLVAACATTPSVSTTAPSASGSPASASTSASAGGGVPASGLAAELPTVVNGDAYTRRAVDISSKTAPRVFLKAIARTGKTPAAATAALGFGPGATIYAVRVAGLTGAQMGQAFLEERNATASGVSTSATLAGKTVTKIGPAGRLWGYASKDAFFYLETKDEATAAGVVKALP